MRFNMIAGALCLAGAAALSACQPSQSFDAPATEAQPLTIDAQPGAPKTATPKVAAKKAVATAGSKTLTVSNAVASDAAHASSAANETRAAAAKQEDETVATTITGCLVLRDDGMFQLKDNDGEHAPKSRSWKSGFIKKGSANIDVLDAGNRLRLGSHVGYRVSVSGALTDREMRARSVRATSQTCD
jgi:hypothetical protein